MPALRDLSFRRRWMLRMQRDTLVLLPGTFAENGVSFSRGSTANYSASVADLVTSLTPTALPAGLSETRASTASYVANV